MDLKLKLLDPASTVLLYGTPPPRAPKRDRVIHEGDKLTVGDTTLDSVTRAAAAAKAAQADLLIGVGAGSVITHAVPKDALALGRARQETKPEWAAKRRSKRIPKK